MFVLALALHGAVDVCSEVAGVVEPLKSMAVVVINGFISDLVVPFGPSSGANLVHWSGFEGY